MKNIPRKLFSSESVDSKGLYGRWKLQVIGSWFVHCFSLGSRKVCCTLLLNLFYYVIFCFACFASQTSGFWSAFPSAPVKSVTRFCYALVRTLFCVFCQTNTGFVQCYSLGSRKVCCMLVFTLLYSVIFCFASLILPHKHRVLCNALPSAPVVYCTLLLLVIYVSCSLPHQHRPCAVLFPSAPLKFTPFCFSLFIQFAFVMRLTSCGLRSDFPRLPSKLHA